MLTEDNKELYENYFQENADYYINQMKKFNQRGRCSFSIPAFFLGFFWMAYRKMYLHVLIITGIVIVEGFIEEALYEYGFISIETYEAIDLVSRIAWGIAIGFLSNRLYIMKSQKAVNRIMKEHSDKEYRIQALTKKGGTSLVAPVLLLVGIVLLIMLSL